MAPAAAAVSEAEIACGQNVIVLADAAIVWRPAFLRFADWNEIDTMMLSGRPEGTALEPFLEPGVEIVSAETETGPARRSWSGPRRGAE